MTTLYKHGTEQLLTKEMPSQGCKSADGYQVMGSGLKMQTLLAAWAR